MMHFQSSKNNPRQIRLIQVLQAIQYQSVETVITWARATRRSVAVAVSHSPHKLKTEQAKARHRAGFFISHENNNFK
ncbi:MULTISPECIES: hypothetical protein [unclassified Janthinobacterium]|uniref:hypothetical protein n=1 Tax=unclassified Janthinobacterium TaxID=2610881 RepID=UPI0011130D97|nr:MULTISPECIES: hypothetical protein [unclassified Janthinobacterium]